jgi:hypothetical protein
LNSILLTIICTKFYCDWQANSEDLFLIFNHPFEDSVFTSLEQFETLSSKDDPPTCVKIGPGVPKKKERAKT